MSEAGYCNTLLLAYIPIWGTPSHRSGVFGSQVFCCKSVPGCASFFILENNIRAFCCMSQPGCRGKLLLFCLVGKVGHIKSSAIPANHNGFSMSKSFLLHVCTRVWLFSLITRENSRFLVAHGDK